MNAFIYKAEIRMDMRHIHRAVISIRKPAVLPAMFPLKVKARVGIPYSMWYLTGCSEKEIASKMAELIKDQFDTPPPGVLIEKKYESSTKCILVWNKTNAQYDVMINPK